MNERENGCTGEDDSMIKLRWLLRMIFRDFCLLRYLKNICYNPQQISNLVY